MAPSSSFGRQSHDQAIWALDRNSRTGGIHFGVLATALNSRGGGLRSAVARDEELRQSRPDLWQSMEATRRAKTGRPLRRTGDSERWGSSHCAFGCLSHSVGRNCSVSNGETPPQLRLSSRNRVAVPARPESAQNRYVYRTFDARRLSSVEKRSRRGSSCQLCV